MRVWHKLKWQDGWYAKLCSETLYAENNLSYYWKGVTCKQCLKMVGKK